MNEDEIYKKYKEFMTPEMTKRITEVYEVETRFAIIMTVVNFGPSNIKEISHRLGKNQATIHHHLQWLTNSKFGPPMLQLDEKKSLQRGKFYKLTSAAMRAFAEPPSEVLEEKMLPKFEEILAMPDEDLSKLLVRMILENPSASAMRKYEEQRVKYNHYMEEMMINNLEQAYHALTEGKKPVNPNYPFGSLSNYEVSVKVYKVRHLFEVLRLFIKFQVELNELRDRIAQDMEKQKIPKEEQILLRYHIFGGEVGEFEFE